MAHPDTRPVAIRATLLGPLRLASVLAVAALIVSLAFLAYTAWSTARRMDPLESHIAHLQTLQQSSMDIQEILIRHFEEGTVPTAGEVGRISDNLKQLLDAGNHLHPDTPDSLRQARAFLDKSQSNVKAGLLAALTIVRKTLEQESALQQVLVRQTRKAARLELAVASAAMLLTPLLALILTAVMRRRSFQSINRLSALLENVGRLEFSTTDRVPSDDPLADVYARYNEMAQKLRSATQAAEQHAAALEDQVRVASETLLRQQSELENGARLAAVGEFAARMAHELRNPISGISAALHNMESELPDGDLKERAGLIADEMGRVTRLLNETLEQGRSTPSSRPGSMRGCSSAISCACSATSFPSASR